MKEAVRRLQDRILFPSDQLGKSILRKIIAPSAILALASILKQKRPAEAGFFTKLGIEHANSPSDLSQKVRGLAMPGLIGGGLLFWAASYLEWRNRVHFGQDLTVSKVAVSKNYIPRIMFPFELSNERFVGELHFQGKWKKRFSQATDAPITVIRSAFRDLYALALEVEKNNPTLTDINYFVGVSSMVDELFERYGFQVAYYKDEYGLPALGKPDQKDLKIVSRPVRVLLFSKAALIANKAKIAKSGHLQP